MKRLLITGLFVLIASRAGAVGGVRSYALIDQHPGYWYQDSIPWLVSLPSTQVEVWSSLMGNGISYRLVYKGYPLATSRTWTLSSVRSRLIGWSTWKEWTEANARNGIRNSGTRGSLVPTIYLPLNMPGLIGDAIGTGGQLDISGHQTISVSGVSHIYPNRVNVEGSSTSLFPDLKMEQDLRIRLDGTIGEKIHVAVDHDSQRQIGSDYSVSLSYDGDDDEIIQSIELGDVNLSITGPEFISYSIPHQGLFGAKLIAQAGPFDITAIASKEGSSTESSDFVGQASLVNDSILDIHPANNYFFRAFPDTVEAPFMDPNHIRVFIDDGDATNNVETGAVEGSWFIPNPSGGEDTESGKWWDELTPGIEGDFVLVDSSRTIRFLRPVNDTYVVAVAMITTGGDTVGTAPFGGPYDLKLIKESNQLSTDLTWQYEMRNYYFLGANNIVRESFNCDIFLQRPGEDPTSVQDGIPFTQVLGLDTNNDGLMYDEDLTMDWENGFVIFPDNRPFASDALEYPNNIVYTEKNPTANQSLYYMRVSYRAASTTYSLGHMGIVEGSERVTLTVAGQARTLVRNTDYSIIYEVGLLTLMGEAADLAQDPANTLRVTFEYVPFFSSVSKTLLGTRVVYNMGSHSWLGGTMMYENANSPETRPRVGEGSFGTTVFDVDVHLETRPEFLTDMVNHIPLITTEAESRVVLSGEVAVSLPSGESKAWLDDMEGSESTFPLGQSRSAWFYSSKPRSGSELLFPVGESRWFNVTDRWSLHDIVPGETSNDALKKISGVLQFVFTPDEGNPTHSWGGFQRCIERYGTDLSSKTHLSLYVRATGCASGANLYIDLGERIDEDTYWLERVGDDLIRQANGLLDTEDTNSDGIRSTTEDTGLDTLHSADEPGYNSSSNSDPNQDNYRYNASDPIATRFNAINNCESNGRLDTEDLNRNGVLDTTNTFFRVRIPLDDPDYIVSTSSTGWMLIQIPVDDSTLVTIPGFCSGTPTWEKITYARIWVDGFTQQDTLEFYDIGLVGNRWKPNSVTVWEQIGVPVQPEESFTVSVVNNRQNQDYINNPPPGIDPGDDQYGDVKLEQSISLECADILGGHEGVARQTFYSIENYTQYRSLSFPFYGTSPGGELFFQMGRDSLNYYEITADVQSGWQLVEVEIQDLVDLKTLKDLTEENMLRSGDLAVVGNPSLSEVMMLGLGVRNTDQTALTNQVWVDDITVKGHYLEPGRAHRITGDIDFADMLLITGDYRMVDDDFHGLGRTSGTGTTVTRYTASSTLNLDRFSPPVWNWSLPATFAWNRSFSEPRYATNSDIRLEGDETWEYRTESNNWDTSIQWRRNGRSDDFVGRYFLDPIHVRHAMGKGWGRAPSTRDSTRNENVSFTYDLHLGRMSLFRMPILEDIRLRPTRIGFGIGWRRGRSVMYDIANEDTVLTRDDTERVLLTDGNVAFNPWKGLTASYNLAVGRDMYYPWDEPYTGVNIGREVSRNQNAALSQELNFWNYLKPRVSWDTRYGMSRLSPHSSTGADTLSRPDVGNDATARLNLRVGLAHTIRSVARLRDERLDEEAVPGSPRWLLSKMERWADRITDPNIVFSRSRGSDYKDVPFTPSASYQFGLEPDIAGLDPYNKTTSNSIQISGGFRPTNTMSVRIEYNDSENSSFYSGFWNRTDNTTWPSVSVSWSGLERYQPLAFLRSGSVSSGYRLETSTSSRIENDSLTPVSKTETSRWSPLISFTGSFDNKVQVTISDNMSTAETRNYTGTSAVVRSGSNSAQFKLSYSFSAPGGIAIPIPFLNRMRLSFRSDLTTALSITRSTTSSEVTGGQTGETQVQSDKTEWRIEPSASYDFGTVTASMTAIYGWKKDKVNNQYDQKDVGLNLSVTINF